MSITHYKRSTTKPSAFTSTTNEERKFYQGSKWRNFRAKMKARALLIDAREMRKLVTANELDGKQYAAWLQTHAPVCKDCIASGIITAAKVLDHIKPIRDGGGVFEPSNLHWLCDKCHNIKSNHDRRNREQI